MPFNPANASPGVYIQEIPSGVHTITGVATSITAFVGIAPRGVTDEPVTIFSYADFERTFGGLDPNYPMSYAVQDFYFNGGSQAVIVRVKSVDSNNNAIDGTWKQTIAGLSLQASSPGVWANNLVVKLDAVVSSDLLGKAFNLLVQEKVGSRVVRTEQLRNLTVDDGPRRIDKVLAAQSQLLRWDATKPIDPTKPPADFVTALKPINDALAALTAANKTLAGDQAAKKDDATIAKDKKAIDDAQKAVYAAQSAFNPQPTAPTSVTPASSTTTVSANSFRLSDGEAGKVGVYALEKVDLFNILCIPSYMNLANDGGDIEPDALLGPLAAYCVKRRAVLLLDAPTSWSATANAVAGIQQIVTDVGSDNSSHVAIYFPRLRKVNPLSDNRVETFPSSGAMAGIFARTDTQRGVWKAPAGLEAGITGVTGLSIPLTNGENGELNSLGINCLRVFPASGAVVWGARTLQGDDRLTSEYKYIPVRRTALYIEESLYRGLQWVVFEPNDEPLWAQIRLNVGAFMHNLFVKGAFQGQKPSDAYFVKCNSETTTQNDIDLGIVNIFVGFAPLKPAEFVVVSLQQIAGQIQV